MNIKGVLSLLALIFITGCGLTEDVVVAHDMGTAVCYITHDIYQKPSISCVAK